MKIQKKSKNVFFVQPVLPKSDGQYSIEGVTFDIYRAKDLYIKKWRSQALKKMVQKARGSYGRYGTRDLFDKFDLKAAVYLARAQYPNPNILDNKILTEWLSVRMVPGDSIPVGVGEIELYTAGNATVTELLCRKIACTTDQLWKYVLSDSRLCGIHPHHISKNKILIPAISERHSYSSECMALMQIQFLIDFPPATLPFLYVSSIVRPEIKDKVITLHKDNHVFKPIFISAHNTLGLAKEVPVKVNRSTYTYQFPRYWLDMQKLKNLIKTLLREGYITDQTLKYYLKTSSLDTDKGEIGLGKLLSVKGKIKGAVITGTKLRELVDREIPDMPELQITPINSWRKAFLKIVDAIGINISLIHPELDRFR